MLEGVQNMSARTVSKVCEQAGCGVTAATGQLVDSTYVFEIRLDDSVTDAKSLYQGMGIYAWGNAKVTHASNNGEVTHTI